MKVAGTTFQIATWNILATAYIRPKFYPGSPPEALDPHRRIPALVQRAGELGVDILCLQEVERAAFAALTSGLAPLGYMGTFALKAGGKPDGCATFFRTSCCSLVNERRLVYADGADGSPDSGHIAQVVELKVNGVPVALVNTHFKWDAPGTPRELQLGLRQAKLAIASAQGLANIQIICGDFTATPESSLVELLRDAGFDYSHRHCSNVFTCNSNKQAKLIDYIFFRGPVAVEPGPLAPIDGHTILPSLQEPSDHLPLTARFTLKSEAAI